MNAAISRPSPDSDTRPCGDRRLRFGTRPILGRFSLAWVLVAIMAVAVALGMFYGLARARHREEVIRRVATPRIAAAKVAYQHAINNVRTGEADPLGLCRLSRRWLEAELEATSTKAARIAAARAHLDRVRSACELAREGIASGEADGDEFAYFASEAEFWVAREGAE